MLGWFGQRSATHGRAQQLYGSSVAQARIEAFYRDLGVPDTVAGRFEMVVLHVFLVTERLKGEGSAGADLARRISELMFSDLDGAMREMGVGDLTVPKKMHAAAGAFYGRMKAYAEALATADMRQLEQALQRNLPGDDMTPDAARIARYVVNAHKSLKQQDFNVLRAGQVRFPVIEEVT